MLDGISSVQNQMGGALKNLNLISNNIANVNTPNYKRQYVDFTAKFQDALGLKKSRANHISLGSDDGFQVKTDETQLREDGNNIDIDTEVMELQDSSLRYQSMIKIVNNNIDSFRTVIK